MGEKATTKSFLAAADPKNRVIKFPIKNMHCKLFPCKEDRVQGACRYLFNVETQVRGTKNSGNGPQLLNLERN